MDKTITQLEFRIGDSSKKYKVERIENSIVYAKKSESGYLLGFYYMVL